LRPHLNGSARDTATAHVGEALAVLAVVALYVTVVLLLSGSASALPLLGPL
jgi:hypothetical protein